MMWIWTMIIVVWLVIGFKRIPVYYKRADAWNAKEYPSMYREGLTGTIVWSAIGLAFVWPLYEVPRIIQRAVFLYVIKDLKGKDKK